jgi:hypothetical protein
MSISMMLSVFVDVRVAGQLSYVPAHFRNGKENSSRVEIPVYANSNRGAKTGEVKKSDSFKLIVWGGLADVCCKSLSKGKALSVFSEQKPYMGRLYDANGNVRNDSTGQPIMIPKMSFTVTKLKFGRDSQKEIAQEVQTGRRPMNWNVPNHPDWALWVRMLNDRQAKTWDCRSGVFEFARVVMPQGQGIVINYAYYAPKAGAAPAENGFNPNLPNMVANAFGANVPAGAKFDPMTGAPINPTPAPLFDAMTGLRLAPVPMFDPMTGQPLTHQAPAASFGFPSSPMQPTAPPIPAAGTALF